MLLALGQWTWPEAATAAELRIYPVRLELSPSQSVGAITVQNSGAQTSLLQLRVMAWRQDGGEETFEPTRDILANPPMMRLAPGAQQIVRVGLRGKPGPREGAYRIFLQEVPEQDSTTAGTVRTLLEVSIPVFVPAERPSVALAWAVDLDGRQANLEVRNTGASHVQVSELTLKAPDGRTLGQQKLSLYVLPGASRRTRVDLSGSVAAGSVLRVEAATDQGPLQGEATAGAATGALRN